VRDIFGYYADASSAALAELYADEASELADGRSGFADDLGLGEREGTLFEKMGLVVRDGITVYQNYKIFDFYPSDMEDLNVIDKGLLAAANLAHLNRRRNQYDFPAESARTPWSRRVLEDIF
jgi:hypothetical protein